MPDPTTMTPEQQLAALAPRARAFADAAFDMKRGLAVVNFDNGIVLYVNNAVPGADAFRGAVRRLVSTANDVLSVGKV